MGRPPQHGSRLARSTPIATLLLIGVLASGCAGFGPPTAVIRPTPVLECPGVARDLPVAIDAAPDSPWRVDIIRRLTAEAECIRAEYDPVNEQGRWAYRVTLKHSDTQPRKYTFHLAALERRITNGLDRIIRDDVPFVSVQEFDLDAVRADIHLPPGTNRSFPCVEQIAAPGTRLRTRSGLLLVHRRYTGDVTVSENGRDIIAFVPVRVAFDVGLVLSAPGSELADDLAREQARRKPEWALLADRCETCRPLVICESLAGKPVQLDPHATHHPPYPTTTAVHVMTGLPRRPVIVDSLLTQRKRTAVCTRWSPGEGTPGKAFLIATDGSDQGAPPASPYLTFHHAAPRCGPRQASGCLSLGQWVVEILTGEIVDDWSDLVPPQALPEDAQQARLRALRDACLQDKDPKFRRVIEVKQPGS